MTVRNHLGTLAILAALPLLAGITFECADAQSPVNPGQRIRATMLNGGVIMGTVVSVSGSESMTVQTQATVQGGGFGGGQFNTTTTQGQTVDVNLSNVRRIELSAGMQSGLKTGLMWGTVGGGALGAVGGAAAAGGEGAVAGLLYGGLIGAANGLWVGWFFLGGEKWVPAPSFSGIGMNLVLNPPVGRSGVAVGLRFSAGR